MKLLNFEGKALLFDFITSPEGKAGGRGQEAGGKRIAGVNKSPLSVLPNWVRASTKAWWSPISGGYEQALIASCLLLTIALSLV